MPLSLLSVCGSELNSPLVTLTLSQVHVRQEGCMHLSAVPHLQIGHVLILKQGKGWLQSLSPAPP